MSTIVIHSTGVIEKLRDTKKKFNRIVAEGNPLIGTTNPAGNGGFRTRWADENEPTDAEVRLIHRSLLVEVAPPTPASGYRAVYGPFEFNVGADEWRETWTTELAPIPTDADAAALWGALFDAGELSKAKTAMASEGGLNEIAWDRGSIITRAQVDSALSGPPANMTSSEIDAAFVAANA